jgi:hypothetical protein
MGWPDRLARSKDLKINYKIVDMKQEAIWEPPQ